MPRERECFREQLLALQQRVEGAEVSSMDQSCKLLGVDRMALLSDRDFPAKKVGRKYIVPLVPLARWMVTWGA